MIRWCAAALAAVLVVGCTGGGGEEVTPAPTGIASEVSSLPTRVAVVLPPVGVGGQEVARLRRGVEAVVAAASRNVELRFVQPDSVEFVADVAAVLAADGWDLVCVLHPAGVEEVALVAASLPGTHYCVDSSRAVDAPSNLWAPRPRYAETSFLVGVAAGLIAGDGVVAALVREGQPALGAKRAALANGHAAVPAPGAPSTPLEDGTEGEVTRPIVGTLSQQEQDVGPIVEAIASQEPRVVVVDVGSLVDDVVARVRERLPGATLIIWTEDGIATALPHNAIVVERNKTVVFRLALEALLSNSFSGLPNTVGVGEGIHTIRATAPGLEGVVDDLGTWIARIASGEVDVAQTG